MLRKFGLLGFAFAALTMVVPTETFAAAIYHYRPGYRYGYFRNGHYTPYRYGYYDRLGRWHRY